MNREKALMLIEQRCDFALKRHLAHVASAMQAMCLRLGHNQNCEDWYVVGLLHDIDWNQTINDPSKHCGDETMNFLKEQGLKDDLLLTIKSHYDFYNLPRDTDMKKALASVDELSGFCVAAALVRPTKMVGMNSSSVIKKIKDKQFARNVDRDSLRLVEDYFSINLSDALDNTILPAFYQIAKDWELA